MNEKLTLEWCFKYYNARIIIADTTTFANVRCMGIPNSPQALDALEKYGQLQLRPLSSLTDEEKKHIDKFLTYREGFWYNWNKTLLGLITHCFSFSVKDLIDYLRSINTDVDNCEERGIAVYE